MVTVNFYYGIGIGQYGCCGGCGGDLFSVVQSCIFIQHTTRTTTPQQRGADHQDVAKSKQEPDTDTVMHSRHPARNVQCPGFSISHTRRPPYGVPPHQARRASTPHPMWVVCKVSAADLAQDIKGDVCSSTLNSFPDTWHSGRAHKKCGSGNLLSVSVELQTSPFMSADWRRCTPSQKDSPPL